MCLAEKAKAWGLRQEKAGETNQVGRINQSSGVSVPRGAPRALEHLSQESELWVGKHTQAALLNCAMREDKFHQEEIIS